LLDLLDGALQERRDAYALDGAAYEQLHAGAARVAYGLHARGVRRGDRVAIYCENRHAFVYAYLAALRLGAIAVPANVLYRANDLATVLLDARPRAVVHSAAVAEFVAAAGMDRAGTIDAADVEAWARDSSAPSLDFSIRPQPDDVALIIFTSGTTGRAKGAMLTHRNLAAVAVQLMGAWRWRPSDTLLLTLPLFHVHGLLAGLTTSLCAGGRVLLRERFDAHDVLETLARGDVTMFFGVPTMYVRLLEAAGDSRVPPMRLYVSGSAALSAESIVRSNAVLARPSSNDTARPSSVLCSAIATPARALREASAFRCPVRACALQRRTTPGRYHRAKLENCWSAVPACLPVIGNAPKRRKRRSSPIRRANAGIAAGISHATIPSTMSIASSDASRR